MLYHLCYWIQIQKSRPSRKTFIKSPQEPVKSLYKCLLIKFVVLFNFPFIWRVPTHHTTTFFPVAWKLRHFVYRFLTAVSANEKQTNNKTNELSTILIIQAEALICNINNSSSQPLLFFL